MKVAAIQFTISNMLEENFALATEHIIAAAQGGADVIVLPELWTTGYDHIHAPIDNEIMIDAIAALAKQLNVNIIAGSVVTKQDDKLANTMYVINRHGERISSYNKAHLFRLMNEHNIFAAGEREHLFELDETTCSAVICYDIRFPEWLRLHAVNGANVIFVVAEWPSARAYQWRHLLIARAIENQCYIVAVNRTGSDANNDYPGQSLIIDPLGYILAEGDDQPGIITAELDFSKIATVRGPIPILTDRRPELYEQFEKNFQKNR